MQPATLEPAIVNQYNKHFLLPEEQKVPEAKRAKIGSDNIVENESESSLTITSSANGNASVISNTMLVRVAGRFNEKDLIAISVTALS